MRDSWWNLPLRSIYSSNPYTKPFRYAIESSLQIASKVKSVMGKRKGGYLRGPNRKKQAMSMSAESCSKAPLSAGASIHSNATNNQRTPTTRPMGDADDGTITTKLSISKGAEAQEFYIKPRGVNWTRTWTDPRPTLHKIINPALIILASGVIEELTSLSPNQLVTTKYFNDYADIIKVKAALLGAVTEGILSVANPLGGMTYQDATGVLEPSMPGDVDNSPFVMHKKQEMHTYRNRCNINVHLVLEEWICVRDTNAKTLGTLDTNRRSTNEILDASNRAGAIANSWETDGTAGCSAFIPITRPGEKYQGAEVNLFWKKLHSTKVVLSSGSTVHYIMAQPKMSVSAAFITHYATESVTYLAGITRALVSYQYGEMVSDGGTKQSYGPSYLGYSHDNFAVVSGVTSIKQKRIETWNAVRTGPYDTIANADISTINNETDAVIDNIVIV